jgi:hypothetical protein
MVSLPCSADWLAELKPPEGIPDEPVWLRPRIWRSVTCSQFNFSKTVQITLWDDITGRAVQAAR